ncbi:Uncharacterised protein [Chlamydia trachomatis]|nr:Uncharacterised protein [Chlamydia trachomatis]
MFLEFSGPQKSVKAFWYQSVRQSYPLLLRFEYIKENHQTVDSYLQSPFPFHKGKKAHTIYIPMQVRKAEMLPAFSHNINDHENFLRYSHLNQSDSHFESVSIKRQHASSPSADGSFDTRNVPAQTDFVP